ncbi:MAG: ABC transporter permease [Chloroflexi bacterium]|nr:ABC transporter permease [Chloroflexota bacterium]
MSRLMRHFQPEQLRELVLFILILLMMFFFSTQIQNYFSPRFFNRVSTSVAIIAVLAVAQTLVVLTANIDLSIGSIVGFTAYFGGQILAHNNDMPPLLIVFIAIGMGLIMGLINGALVAYGGVPSIIVTLGTLAIYRSALVQFSGAQTVLTANLPEWILELPRMNVFSIGKLDFRVMVALALAVVLLFHFILKYTSYGRRLYAIGSNSEAAEMAGIPSKRIVFMAFLLSGALSGLAGFMFLARFGTITVVAGLGLEFAAVGAVVVGGVNIFGGSGTMLGALLGATLINILDQSLIRWMAISEFWRDFLLGFLILMSVALDAVVMNRLKRLWARKDMAISGRRDEHPIEGVSHG